MVEALIIFQTPVLLHQATLASSVQVCTPPCPPALLSLQEVQAQINTFPQFSHPLFCHHPKVSLTPEALVPSLNHIIPPPLKQRLILPC